MRTLVTGGLGFIGGALTRKLLKGSDRDLVLLDALVPEVHGKPPPTMPIYWPCDPRVRIVQADIRDAAAIHSAFASVDEIVHLAADTSTTRSMSEPARCVDVNVRGTAVIMEEVAAMRHRNLRRFVFASSRAVYGPGAPDFRPSTEKDPLIPASVYGASKVAGESLVSTLCGDMGIDSIALRFQNVYGPGQSLRNRYSGFLATFVSRALVGLPIEVYEDGQMLRDMIYVDDAADAIVAALGNVPTGHRTYDVGAGMPVTVLSLANMVRERLAPQGPDVFVTGSAPRPGDVRHAAASSTLIRHDLGWRPRVDLAHGIHNFCTWARDRGDVRLAAAC